MQYLSPFVNSPWFQLSSFAIGILGIIIALLTAYLSRKTKRISFSRRSFRLVEKNRSTLSALQVTFGGRAVDSLTVTKLLIWNSGNEPIRDQDLPNKEKLRITTQGEVELLESEVIQASAESCNCTLGPITATEQKISFDFLDPNDGLVIQVAHTGTSGGALSIEGQIVGRGKVAERVPGGFFRSIMRPPRVPRGSDISSRYFRWGAGLSFCSIGAMCIIGAASTYSLVPALDVTISGILFFAGVTYAMMGVSIIRSRPPRGLEKFDDNFAREVARDNAPTEE